MPAAPGVWKMFLLPMLLSFLPIVAGYWEARRFEEFTDRLETKRLHQTTDAVAARLRRTTTPSFWPGEQARRLRRGVSTPTALARIRATSFGTELVDVFRHSGLKNLPKVRLWAAKITSSSTLEMELCREKGLETKKGALIRSLLREICRHHAFGHSDLDQWENRLTTMFGGAVTSDLFKKGHRGRPIPVRTPDGFGFLVWEVIEERNKPIGAFLLFYPSGLRGLSFGLHYTMFNWQQLDVVPAFIEFPTRVVQPRPNLLIHPSLRSPEATELLLDLWKQMGLRPSLDPKVDGVGLPWIPTALQNRVLHRGDLWFRVCNLAPETGALGLLLGRSRPSESRPSRVLVVVGMIMALAWVVLLFRGFAHGWWPNFTIENSLMFWFLGLASVPVMIGFLSGASYLINHEENLKDELTRSMRAAIANMDQETARLPREQEMMFRDLCKDPTMGPTIRNLHLSRDRKGLEAFKSAFSQRCKSQGITLQVMEIIGHRGFVSYVESMGFRPSVTQVWLEAMHTMYGRKLGDEPRAITAVLDAHDLRNSSGTMSDLENPWKCGETTIFSSSKARAGGLISNLYFSKNAGAITYYQLNKTLWGKASIMNLVAPIMIDNDIWYVVSFVWDQDLAFKRYFLNHRTEIITNAEHRDNPFQIGVIHRNDRQDENIFPATFPARIQKLITELGGQKTLIETKIAGQPTIVQILPSQRATGFTFVATASLEGVYRQIAREARMLVVLLILSLVLLIVGAYSIAAWLAGPLGRMSTGLARIAAGNLDETIAEQRHDELGEAGRILDTMTKNLRERRTITRFVAPQVIEAVSGGNLQAALETRKRHVAILASDIREFTPISERYPPPEVFAALNEHLKAMTSIIQSFGGTIDRFIGDAIVAVFYASDGASPELRAFSAARAMMDAHETLVHQRQAAGRFPYAIGIGIDAGDVLAGAIGNQEIRLDYSVLGEPVHRASHLESLSKRGKASRIIVSDQVRQGLRRQDGFLPIEGDDHAWEAENPDIPIGTMSAMVPSPVGKAPPSWQHRNTPAASEQSLPSHDSTTSDRPCPARTLPQPGSSKEWPRPASGMSEPGFHTTVPTGRWLPPIFWVTTLILISIATASLFRTYREADEQRIRELLIEQAGLMPQRFDPESVLSKELVSRTTKPCGAFQEDPATATFFSEVLIQRLETLDRMLPDSRWVVTDVAPPPPLSSASDTADSRPGYGELLYNTRWPKDFRIIAMKGFPREMQEVFPQFFLMGWACRNFINSPDFVLPRDVQDWMQNESPRLIGETTNRDLYFANMDSRARWNIFQGVQAVRFMHFLDKRALSGKAFGPLRQHHQTVWPATTNNRTMHFWKAFEQFEGGIFYSYLPPGNWLELVGNPLSQELASAGLGLALLHDDTIIPLQTTASPFTTKTSVQSLDSLKGCGVTNVDGYMVLMSNSFMVQNRPANFILSRKTSPWETFTRLPALPLLFILFWLLLGMGWIFQAHFLPAFSGLKLGGRLMGAFFITLLPSFVLCSLVLARSGMEAETRIRAEAGDTLFQSIEQIEQGHDLCINWTRNLLRREIPLSKLAKPLPPDPAMPIRERITLLCKEMLINLARKGAFVLRVIFTPAQGDAITASSDAGRDERKETEQWAIVSALLKSMAGHDQENPFEKSSGGVDSKAFLIQSQSRDFLNAMALLFGEEAVGEMFLRPENWNFMITGDTNRNIFFVRILQQHREKAEFLGIDIGPGYIERLNFHGIASVPLEFDFEKMKFTFLKGVPPTQKLVGPFFRFPSEGNLIEPPTWVEVPLSDDVQPVTAMAEKSRDPVFSRIGSGASESLDLFCPSLVIPQIMIQGRIFVGSMLEIVRQDFRTNSLILLGILIATIFLARAVARQFLVPVRALIEACHIITSGDYTARLPSSWNGEFAILAEAFNTMAREAQEGRLIGRFVSDSVREVAQRRSLDPAVLEGKADRAVILFAGLSGFKGLLETRSPEAVFQQLNGYLALMSGIIRDHGGEIDKFIGDKILAVFPASADGRLSETAASALATALAMRQAMPLLAVPLPCDLGIGMVAGPVLKGILGTPDLRLEFTVIGDTVNLASRLCDLAISMPGGAVLLERQFAQAHAEAAERGSTELVVLPAVRVKGKAREIDILKVQE